MYYIANDPGVPEDVRAAMSRWGLPKDEFNDNGHWPHQIYVREARRMVTDFVMTERHLLVKEPTPEPIGMGSYNMDSHNVRRYVDAKGHARNEGDIQVEPRRPVPDQLPSDRAEGRRMHESARAGLPRLVAYRLWFDPDGTRLHHPRPVRRPPPPPRSTPVPMSRRSTTPSPAADYWPTTRCSTCLAPPRRSSRPSRFPVSSSTTKPPN